VKTQLALPGHAIGELRAMGTANHGGVSALSLNFPTAAALDAQGNLHIADNSNHRVAGCWRMTGRCRCWGCSCRCCGGELRWLIR